MLVCSNVSPASLGGIDRAAADFRELGERAAARGLRVGFEALAWGRHVNDYRDAWEIVRRADHKSIGLILDSFHALAPAFPITRRSSRSRPTRSFWSSLPMRRSSASTCCPGAGISAASRARAICRWRPSWRPCAATGYAGPLSLEIFNDQFRAGSAVRTATDGLRSLILLEDQSARDERVRRRGTLPPKAQSRGVGFIEFAVDEAKASELAAAVRPARLSQDRRASQQGCGALVAGQYRTRDQLRAGRLCPFALYRARPRRLRHRDRCR